MPQRIVVLCLLGSLVVATAAARAGGAPPRPAVPGLGAVESASRIVDRTFTCAPRAFGGVSDLDFYVSPMVGGLGATHLFVRTGALNPSDNLVIVRPRPVRKPGWFAGVVRGAAGVFVNSRRCAPSREEVALSARGLPGPPSVGYRELDCPTRGRVVVRVRSVIRRPVAWRRIDRSFAGVRQPIVRSQVSAEGERSGKSIAYMEHDAEGRTKLWFSSGCS